MRLLITSIHPIICYCITEIMFSPFSLHMSSLVLCSWHLCDFVIFCEMPARGSRLVVYINIFASVQARHKDKHLFDSKNAYGDRVVCGSFHIRRIL